MDTSGPSREDSPPQVFPIGTSSSPSDASIRSLVVQAIQDSCNGKLMDDLSQFQSVEQQGEITFSIVNACSIGKSFYLQKGSVVHRIPKLVVMVIMGFMSMCQVLKANKVR